MLLQVTLAFAVQSFNYPLFMLGLALLTQIFHFIFYQIYSSIQLFRFIIPESIYPFH